MSSRQIIPFFLLFLLAFSFPASAATYYVDDGVKGSDGNAGGSGDPWKTVTKALNSTSAGDVINIAAGIYYGPGGARTTWEVFPLVVDGQTLVGSAPTTTIIRGDASETMILNSSSILENCWVRNLSTSPAQSVVSIYAGERNVEIKNTYLSFSGGYWGYPADSRALYLDQASGVQVTNSVLANAGYGLYANNSSASVSGSTFIYCNNGIFGNNLSSNALTINGNTITKFLDYGIRNASGTIINNIIVSSPEGAAFANSNGIYNSAGSASCSYNDVYNNSRNYYNADPGVGAISREPKFSDAGNDNYALNPSSPCIGAGEDGTDIGANAFDHGATSTPAAHVIYPADGDEVIKGADTVITWYATSSVSTVDLSYSTDGGSNYTSIASSLSNPGSYIWSAPDTKTSQARLKLTASTAIVETDNFTITAAAAPDIPTPTTSTTTTTLPLAQPFLLNSFRAYGVTSSGPASLTLDLTSAEDGRIIIVIFEIGPPPKTVFEKSFNVAAGQKQVAFSLLKHNGQDLPPGNYGFKIIDVKTGLQVSGSFVLQTPTN